MREPGKRAAKRAPLNRDRVVTAAITLADEKGETGISMRAIAARLGVEAMSLYNHVSGREDMLDGMVDAVFAEIDLPAPAEEWKQAMRERAVSSRAALRRHPWAVGLMDSRRTPGPATLRHHDAVIGVLRAGGFSVAMTAHAFSAIDSYLYGFVLQELSLPFTGPGELGDVAEGIQRALPEGTHPHLLELMTEHALLPGYSYADEFEFGLSLILDALRPDEV
ncbi:AcrR family transcriptional regulator [Prauserella marina]|uniref:Regulatory protein, tetR family n=1 Tax=Prauserella marina TaxID=530584 RepID=A0A222VNT9_9PSEU|nr:TetR/AcrR family transcriptional regulator [Prauserella marina]ASR35578.1 AcrR family transcriptional regulator [Prauserella marina]PWV84568.1 TetR family transcriptional regulator [Prauserella marina]SDC18965.1 regulatory protein, tetR family [Prauserella marina]